ncbi:hypothetical protein ED407_03055 [Listeria monocytogenes]|nr:hypothetical protein [Listeria monocytogenes]EAD5322759.1 hypothetical protein [Listeria monocytogenes]EAE0718353.1 hypothetical protein [Listeria monocytogenes]EAE9197211.1 hypothetical protein [Listeria monocytogenes]EAE9206281.1 hypothetical protein [Listeria monocytogenes]
MIQDIKACLKELFPNMTFLGYTKNDDLDAMVVIQSTPIPQTYQIDQSRIREGIGFLIYDKNVVQAEQNYQQLQNYFLITKPSDLAIPNNRIINTSIASGGQVDYDDKRRLMFQLTIQFEKEM